MNWSWTFKIVEIVERGKSRLCIVPEAWENNGILYWPRTKADKLLKEANSIPGANWFRTPCTPKKDMLETLESAENEMRKMLQCDATDESELAPSKKKPSVPPPPKINVRKIPTAKQTNFNTLAEPCVQTPSSKTSTVAPNIKKTLFLQNPLQPTITDPPPLRPFQMSQESSNQSDLFVNLASAQRPLGIEDFVFQLPLENNDEKYERILKNQDTIIANQAIILNELANFGAMFSELMRRYDKEKKCEIDEQPVVKVLKEVDPLLKDFKPIESLEELNLIEDKLKNEEFSEALAAKLSFICGKAGGECGLNVCYALVDNLFTRKFMTLCSWAGGSRGEKEKIPFKLYRNVIDFFSKLVHLADNEFTLENCENFFKSVIRNSTRRNEVKKAGRSSRCKRRPKKLSYKIKAHRGENNNGDSVVGNEEEAENETIEQDEVDLTDYEGSRCSEDSFVEQ